MEKHLHIICHDVPFPPDYGGVFDLFYKIKTLHEMGVLIHLHCFEYGRGKPPELETYCQEIRYYARKEGHKGFSHRLPYIVCSRSNGDLLDNLLKDDYPILMEGVHCSFLLNDDRFAGRKLLLRVYNVEHLYYRQLFRASISPLKKAYYLHESWKLKKYEKQIANKATLIAFTGKDVDFFRDQFGAREIHLLHAFLPFQQVNIEEGTGCYCLYHGNLSVEENERAATWLLKEVFRQLDLPLVIAGKNPSHRLARIIEKHPHACLIANPSEEEIRDVVRKAQVHTLPSFNNTGIKLKLLHALFNGRHCVVNEAAVCGTGLESVCHVCTDASSFRQAISEMYNRPLTREETTSRKQLLSDLFNNEKNARQLIQWIW